MPLLHLPRQPAQLRIHEPRYLRRPVEITQRLERAHDVAERAALDVAAADRFSYPFLNTLSGILNCPPVAVSLSAKISGPSGLRPDSRFPCDRDPTPGWW